MVTPLCFVKVIIPVIWVRTDYSNGTFSGDAWFNDATFKAEAGFYDVIFSKEADFSDAIFSGDARFDLCNFDGRIVFDGTTFGSDATFNYAKSSGPVSLTEARFNAVPDFIGMSFRESVRLDDLNIVPAKRYLRRGDKNRAARNRVLKKLASMAMIIYVSRNFCGRNKRAPRKR